MPSTGLDNCCGASKMHQGFAFVMQSFMNNNAAEPFTTLTCCPAGVGEMGTCIRCHTCVLLPIQMVPTAYFSVSELCLLSHCCYAVWQEQEGQSCMCMPTEQRHDVCPATTQILQRTPLRIHPTSTSPPGLVRLHSASNKTPCSALASYCSQSFSSSCLSYMLTLPVLC